ncbi:MAG: hypothetical protein MUE33_09365 [Cytophagaceae bacterium]|jgi:hypothetical protein|nr:hypothetical protein [Cytophagaceae bacterium]
MNTLRSYIIRSLWVVLSSVILFASCQKKQVMCPGLGQSNEADISMFDENGNLKEQGKKKKKSSSTVGRFDANTGLVSKKKSPAKAKARKRV